MGFKLSAEADDEFNTENAHPKSPRHIFDEEQGSVEDDSLIFGSKSSSEESTRIEKGERSKFRGFFFLIFSSSVSTRETQCKINT